MESLDIEKIEALLSKNAPKKPNGQPQIGRGGHYRSIKLKDDKELGIDFFSNSARRSVGHVRVHVFNVSASEADKLDFTAPPKLQGECTDCRYPAWYPGPMTEKDRRYFGFQWHTHSKPKLSDSDHKLIELSVRWLLKRFPPLP